MNKNNICTKIASWVLTFTYHDYTTDHSKGTYMQYIDALSKYPVCKIADVNVTHKTMQAQESDKCIITIKEILKTNPCDNYLVKGNIL